MIFTLQAMTTAALGEPEKIGPWIPPRADRCRKTRSFSKCGRHFGAATSPGFPLRTEKTWCRVPGASKCHPSSPAEEDYFLHVFEIGNTGATGKKRNQLIDGVNFVGAASESGPFVLFSTSDTPSQGGEVSLPDLACDSLIISGLLPDTVYELNFTGPNVSSSPTAALPGVLVDLLHLRANSKGVLRLENAHLRNLRLRIARI